MNPGLVFLLRMWPVRMWRSTRRRMRGVKGVLTAVVVGVLFLFLVLSQLLSPTSGVASDLTLQVGPVMLFLFTALAVFSGTSSRVGLYFRPFESASLFPAPVSRRQLLAYHLSSRLVIQGLSGLWVVIFVARHAGTWYGAAIGLVLAFWFLQVLVHGASLLVAVVRPTIAWLFRWGIMTVLVLTVADAGLRAMSVRDEPSRMIEAATAAPVLQILSAPFLPFVEAFAATGIAGVATWTGASVLVVAATASLLFLREIRFEETALEVGQRVQAKLDRMRTGGGALAMIGPSKAHFGLPRFPSFSGAGAIAWRQAIEAVRNVKTIASTLAMLMIAPVAMYFVMIVSDPGDKDMTGLVVALLSIVVMMSFTMSQQIAFDIRRDVDRVAYLRSLPLSATAVVAGQITVSAVVLALVQTIAVGAIVVATGAMPLWIVVPLFVLLLPLTWLATAIDNALFLWMPNRFDPEDASNVGFMGKLMLHMAIKFSALGAVIATGVGFGAAGYFLLGESIVAAVVMPVIVILIADVACTGIAGSLFAAFDPAVDTPD